MGEDVMRYANAVTREKLWKNTRSIIWDSYRSVLRAVLDQVNEQH